MLLLSTSIPACHNRAVAKRRQYHHGNLREALLEASVQVIREAGPKGLTLRDVARRAGVSHNAPYRHFDSKEALLAAVAGQGFRELKAAMLKEAKGHNAAERLRQAGIAYVAFALRRPQHFAAMFDSPFPEAKYPESAKAGQEAFETLVALVEACQTEGLLAGGPCREMALYSWSLVHGVAKLAAAGMLPYRSKAEILSFTRALLSQPAPTRRELT